MQEFRPECTINLHLESRGRASKQVWVCSLIGEGNKKILTASGFSGMVSKEAALLTALQFTLEQANRLRLEKIELCTDQPVEEILLSTGKRGAKSVDEKRIQEQCKALWERFRLRRLTKQRREEMAALKAELDYYFPSSSRRGDRS